MLSTGQYWTSVPMLELTDNWSTTRNLILHSCIDDGSDIWLPRFMEISCVRTQHPGHFRGNPMSDTTSSGLRIDVRP